jgi:hypothetical protein
MAWLLKVSVEAIEIEAPSSLTPGSSATVKRGLGLQPFQVLNDSVWGAWEMAEQKVTDDLLSLLEPPPMSLGVH